MAPADALAERLLKRFPPGRAYAADDLRRDGLPRALAHFIEQALQRRLVLEREVLDAARDGARSPWFDPEAAPVQAAWQAYIDALGATARVPADEWPHALRQAARQVTAFLLRPAPALTAFVFADEAGELAADVLLRRMAYFSSYPYLQEVVGTHLRERGRAGLDRKTFAELLERVERRTPETYGTPEWKVLLADLFESLGNGIPARVPGALLAPLLADKGLSDIARRLAAASADVSLDEVVALLSGQSEASARGEGGAASAEAPPEAEAPAAPPAMGLARPPLPRDPNAPETIAAPPEPRPAPPVSRLEAPDPPRLEVRDRAPLRAAPATDPVPPAPRAEPSPRVPPPAPAAEEKRPLWQRFVPGRSDAAPASASTGTLEALEARVLGAIPAAQRQTFVRGIFRGDARAYGAALERIAAADSWTSAARILLDVFQQQGVDLYDPAAIALTDATEQRFLK